MQMIMWSNWNSHERLMGVQNGPAICKTAQQFLRKWNTHLLFTLEISFLDAYLREMKTYVYTHTKPVPECTGLFIIVNTRKQLSDFQLVCISLGPIKRQKSPVLKGKF